MKKIVLGKHIGFCKGVDLCINLVEKELKNKNKVFACGELLHNNQEMLRLESLGVKVIKDINEIDSLENISLIIRAHGVEKEIYQQLLSKEKIKIIDATCPIVKNNQIIVEKYSNNGFNVIVYGDIDHPEIKALVSYISDKSKKFVISSSEDVQKIDISTEEPVILISQTTKPVEEYKKICDLLKTKFKNIKVFNTICRETILREKEVEDLAKKVDNVIIIGGKNSANTKKLVSIAKKYNNNVFAVSSEEEIENFKINNDETIGILSGASTPKWLIQKVIDKLNTKYKIYETKNIKHLFAVLYLILVFSITILLFTTKFLNSSYNNNYDSLNFIYNKNLYLFKFEDKDIEEYIDNLRYKIIKNIEPLVVTHYRYDSNKCNLYTLATMIGTNIESIRSTNYVEAIGLLYSGKELLLHNKKGMLYKIRQDNTNVETITKKFAKDIKQVCDINNIPPTYMFKKGEYVFLPDTYIKFKDFMMPLCNTRITSEFGLRKHPLFGILKYHEGIDLKQRYGATVRAACDGKVIYTGWAEGYGKLVILKHYKNYTTYYGHLSKIKVKVGQWVNKGQVIGNVGTTGWTTGPHLHFEVRKDGVPINPKKVLF
jgi:4-hydroxy-3-methylbut-2-enyl diphosphate reductase